jgi:pyruvate dehydrogenase (quinone)
VCAGSCSPGNLHLINGQFDCHRSHVPVLTIAAHLFRARSHYCELVSNAHRMPGTLEIAIREAVSKRVVSVVMFPGDVALQEATPAALAVSEGLLPRPATIVPDAGLLTRLAALINEVERVTILCGSGAK